jgi:Domain of unknown function (DUF4272)
MEDDLDIELRPAADVARRAIVVAAVLQRVSLDEAAAYDGVEHQGEAFDLREWISAEHLTDALTSREALIFEAQVGAMRREDRLELSWQTEALAALLWSLGFRQDPVLGTQSELATLLDNAPSPWESANDWVMRARLRSESDIAGERELADIWRWRLGAELERRTAHASERVAYDQAIRDVIDEAIAAGFPVDAKRGDFVVSGRLIRDLAPQELDTLAALADERLRALNWICGFGSSWDDVPLDI